MGRKYRNPLTNPLHYATPQLHSGPPVTYAAAHRGLTSYDYGTTIHSYSNKQSLQFLTHLSNSQ
jgi:choline dehydrogenase